VVKWSPRRARIGGGELRYPGGVFSDKDLRDQVNPGIVGEGVISVGDALGPGVS
jgi:hypothetical protein